MVRHLLSKNQTRNKNKESFQRDGGSYCMPFNVIKMVDVYFDAKRLRQLFLQDRIRQSRKNVWLYQTSHTWL